MSACTRTTYLGLELANPVVASACPLTERIDVLQQLEDAGVAAAVFPSLFEEQIEQEEAEINALYESGVHSFAEAVTYLPELDDYNVGPDGYLRRLEEAKRAVSIPVIASLNGATPGGWVRYASLMQDAGADAIELNIYIIAADAGLTAGEVEHRHASIVSAVRDAVSIPLAVKMSPFITSLPHLAMRLVEAGADGLVLFNRFFHPDLDIEQLEMRPDLVLSDPRDLRLPMAWTAILRGRVEASIAASGGVEGPEEVIKLLLAGADVTMTASSLYRHGPVHVTHLLNGLRSWMEEHGYESVEQLRGSMSHEHCPDPSALERIGYMKTVASFSGRRRI